MTSSSAFWDALAPYHATIEDNLFDRRSIRRLMPDIQSPVLIIGAGQGLIVGELLKNGVHCDGVDFSPEMIRYAKNRRGLSLIHADARALPLPEGAYNTVIFATGVIDFTRSEEVICVMLKEGRRVLRSSGKMFVAFYRISPGLEDFVLKVQLLRNGSMLQRQNLEIYLLSFPQLVSWISNRAKISRLSAFALVCRMSTRTTLREKTTTFRMQKIFRKLDNPRALINTAPDQVPYRNEPAIRKLFEQLRIRILQLHNHSSCWVAQI